MKKIVLVDGNNLLFRSYYATLYTGNIMRNKDGFPTNGVYGFVNMINKIVNDEKPEYMMVAFDIGKTFRHEKYERYKDGRKETPDELKVQFPIAKKILAAMGIKYLECAGYEADDIIGTVSMWCEKDPEYEALIVSSDKDLLQLISDETTVKDYIMMDRKTFNETYGFEPIHMIDLKALMGDASDNIPGVRGIGEKGAIKLVSEYTTIENIYANINNIKGATQTKLIEGEDDAYYSKDLVTIYRDVPLDISFDDLKYKNCNIEELTNIYKELGFYSLLKKLDDVIEEDKKKEEIAVIDITEEYLKERAYEYKKTPFDKLFYVKNFTMDEGFYKGIYTFQNIGSVSICDIVGGGDNLLDACAAPGGKSVLLSEKFDRVTSVDIHPHRVELISDYAKRMKRNNITAVCADSQKHNPDFTDKFDAVLCDVPCSGFGVAFESPDIKLNREESSIEELNKIQLSIVKTCSDYVKPGGFLYYSTCSIFNRESQVIIDEFMSDELLKEKFVAVDIDSKNPHLKTKSGLQFLPHLSGGGFFVAKLKRIK